MALAPPSAQGSLLLGSTRALQHDQLGTYARAMAAHGDIARFRVGPPGIGFTFDAVFNPEGAHQVLAADAGHYIKDAPVIGEFRYFLGNGPWSVRVNDGGAAGASPSRCSPAVPSVAIWRPSPPRPPTWSRGARRRARANDPSISTLCPCGMRSTPWDAPSSGRTSSEWRRP